MAPRTICQDTGSATNFSHPGIDQGLEEGGFVFKKIIKCNRKLFLIHAGGGVFYEDFGKNYNRYIWQFPFRV